MVYAEHRRKTTRKIKNAYTEKENKAITFNLHQSDIDEWKNEGKGFRVITVVFHQQRTIKEEIPK